MRRIAPVVLVALASLSSCERGGDVAETDSGALRAAFLIEDGTFNSELTAPMDILHHTPFHAPPGIEVITVARTRDPVRTFEGLVILPDHDYASAPPFDILVVPSAERHVDEAFEDEELIKFVRERGARAKWIMSLCDGAFVLAKAGLLDGRTCTTFPGDLKVLRDRYPAANVVDGVTFVVDDGLITGAGGSRSFEPAMWLVERLFGEQPAQGVARGMVIDWAAEAQPHLVVDRAPSLAYAPGDTIDPGVTVTDRDGAPVRLLDVASEDDRVLLLVIFGGGDAKGEARRGGLWCEDSMNEMTLVRHLMHRFDAHGVGFIGVACPPVFHEERFGHALDAFNGEVDPTEFATFVAATERATETGVLPFEVVHYDAAFRLGRNLEKRPAPDEPTWVGRFRAAAAYQTYGTPTIWILSRTGEVLMPAFHGNAYEGDGVLRYTAREVGFAVQRALKITEK